MSVIGLCLIVALRCLLAFALVFNALVFAWTLIDWSVRVATDRPMVVTPESGTTPAFRASLAAAVLYSVPWDRILGAL